MTVGELIEELKKWPQDQPVYVDFDREGGNESETRKVEKFHPFWVSFEGVKIT